MLYGSGDVFMTSGHLTEASSKYGKVSIEHIVIMVFVFLSFATGE